MIDYQDLKNKFRATLDTFNVEMLSRWIDFDQERDTVSKLLGGETVNVKNTTVNRVTLSDDKDKISLSSATESSQYAMAA
jgi:hypothetical protein